MNLRPTAVEAFHLPGESGQRFCAYHAPADGPACGGVLFVHPFAEEMNKSRRMAAQQARALAACGYGVLQIDLHGCGDSSGDFGDATWATWIDDVLLGWSWLREHCAAGTHWMWGLRAGCLLAAAAARQMQGPTRPDRFLFWQPAAQGRTLMQQFMRLRLAADTLRSGEHDNSRSRERAGAGAEAHTDNRSMGPAETDGDERSEVAGYVLHPGLRTGLAAAELAPPHAPSVHARWFEITTREGASLLPATQRASERWQSAGHDVHSEIVAGPGFWQTLETEVAPSLIEASTQAVLRVDVDGRA